MNPTLQIKRFATRCCTYEKKPPRKPQRGATNGHVTQEATPMPKAQELPLWWRYLIGVQLVTTWPTPTGTNPSPIGCLIGLISWAITKPPWHNPINPFLFRLFPSVVKRFRINHLVGPFSARDKKCWKRLNSSIGGRVHSWRSFRHHSMLCVHHWKRDKRDQLATLSNGLCLYCRDWSSVHHQP